MHDFTIVDLGGLVAAGWVLVRALGPLKELHERVDFLERALATRQPPSELPQAHTPVSAAA